MYLCAACVVKHSLIMPAKPNAAFQSSSPVHKGLSWDLGLPAVSHMSSPVKLVELTLVGVKCFFFLLLLNRYCIQIEEQALTL